MRTRWFSLILSACMTLSVVSGAAMLTTSNPDPDRAMQDFWKAYWDADQQYFLAWNRDAPFPRTGGAGPKGGKYSDFWWMAQLWDLVMDAYERDPKPEYRERIDAVYNGFATQYPDWLNDYNDDLGWWAQAALRAHTLTQNPRYLERARTLFDDIWTYWSDTYGGGVTWRRSNRAQKNVATNGPLTVIAVRLYQATKDARYLEHAHQLYEFVDAKLTDGDARVWDNIESGELRRWDFTYNFGNFVLASLALREVTDDAAAGARLLERSVKAADWVLHNLTNAGTLLDEGTGDGGGFKGVFVRALARLARENDLESGVRERFARALLDNAITIWNNRRASDGLIGSDWASMPNRGVIESLTAASGVAALQLTRGSLEARIPTGDGRYESENSVREGVNPSVTAKGYSGRGYINNFFKAGQFVAFRVNVPQAGRYSLIFRYSAGGGAALRSIMLNSRPPLNLELPGSIDWGVWKQAVRLEFPATPDWNTWANTSVRVELPAGSSGVAVRFEQGSRNWLNLDSMLVVPEVK
jgi:predicted alpha-1,6-mannanase (GH76 family)